MLQETKAQDDDFPFHEFSDMGIKYLFQVKNHIMALLFFKIRWTTEKVFAKNLRNKKDLLCLKRIILFSLMFMFQMAILLSTEKYEYKLNWFNSLNLFLKEDYKNKKNDF